MSFVQHPGGDHFIESPEEAIGRDFLAKLGTEDSLGLALANGGANQAEVFNHVLMRKRRQKTRALAQFHLQDHGQVAIGAKGFQVKIGRGGEVFRRAKRWRPVRRGPGS